MADFPYTSNAARVKELLERIKSGKLGVPTKVGPTYLESVGFKSKNDRPIVPILRTLGFIDANGVPTQRWKDFRSTSTAGAAMAAALRETYSALFDTYPDANRLDTEALRNFFSTHTDLGDSALRFMVTTFKTLCEMADFGAEAPAAHMDSEVDQGDTGGDSRSRVGSSIVRKSVNAGGLTVNINIQLTLPDTDNVATYDSFFASMKKHLFPGSDDAAAKTE